MINAIGCVCLAALQVFGPDGACVFSGTDAGEDAVCRERLREGWEFSRDGSDWKGVAVPHDWLHGSDVVFPSATAPHLFHLGFFDHTGVGYYRYRFTPTNACEKLRFECDGAMMNPTVFLNGLQVGGWAWGYTPFAVDLTKGVKWGEENTLIVRLDVPTDHMRWYTGAGLVRDCRLARYRAGHVVPDSIVVTTESLTDASATVRIDYELSDAGRKSERFAIANPRRWDVESPNLYTLRLRGETVRFGLRTISFHGDMRGFQLNGRRVPINGVCIHDELGCIGGAWNRGAMERRLRLLKEAGVNAVRTVHNEFTPEFYDLCDELGLMVKDEIFDDWEGPRSFMPTHCVNSYNALFAEWHERDIETWVKKDRNHPSVIMYSVGNEIDEGFPERGYTTEHFAAQAAHLRDCVRRWDATRPVTNGNNNPVNFTNSYAKASRTDIFGFNYFGYRFEAFRKANPGLPFFNSESQCGVTSRGEFYFPVKWGDAQMERMSAHATGYGTEAPWDGDPEHGWACAADAHWHWMDLNPACMGEFVWVGIDYVGAPYWVTEMAKKKPDLLPKGMRVCTCGFYDTAGFRKDTFYLYQSRWMPDKPMAHVLPHWNWPERAGEVTPVHVFTTGDEGELFLNGRSLGRRRKEPGVWDKAYRLVWDDVRYEPGRLEVVTYRSGREWARDAVETTGEPVRVELVPEAGTLPADGEALLFVTARIVDAHGRVVPRAKDELTFSVEGPAEIVATDNGDETDGTNFTSPVRRAYNGLAQVVVRAKKGAAGTVRISVGARGLGGDAKSVMTR